MSRFLTEVLPKALVDAQKRRIDLEHDKMGIAFKLSDDEEYRDHDCNCDRCPSQDYEPLSRLDREDLEQDFEEVDIEITALDKEIKRMISYKTFMEEKANAQSS